MRDVIGAAVRPWRRADSLGDEERELLVRYEGLDRAQVGYSRAPT
jgi:hypothetical protein